jgi:hypothetical protein
MAFYFTGSVTGVRHLLGARLLGYMNTPANGHSMNEWVWAADNGCFGKNYVGDNKWFDWLNSFDQTTRSLCAFATAPDVVGSATETMKRSKPWLPLIRQAGYKAALVAQDGLVPNDCPWDEIDALFIGGSTEWKLSQQAADLMIAAKKKNKWVHVGRVNSWRRYVGMAQRGADSVDGTFIAFGPNINAPKLMSWVDRLAQQPMMFEEDLYGEQE